MQLARHLSAQRQGHQPGRCVDSDRREQRDSAEQIPNRLGFVQQVPLCIIDADLTHALQHFGLVHEFGDRLDAHHSGHINETAYRGGVQRIVDHFADEAAVDLQQVDLEVFR
jgi:hypothetical protein